MPLFEITRLQWGGNRINAGRSFRIGSGLAVFAARGSAEAPSENMRHTSGDAIPTRGVDVNLAERCEASEKVMARFREKPFDWRNRRTCIHLARAQARALGHRPPRIPDFQSPIGARRALRSSGFDGLETLLDSLFPRIAPLAMWIGDLVLLKSDDEFGSLAVSAGDKLLGYHQDHLDRGLVALVPDPNVAFVGAWRL